jgi:hypothetical protein
MSAPTLNPQREAEASLDKAFTEHTVHTKTDEELVQFLHVLENRAVHNDLVRHCSREKWRDSNLPKPVGRSKFGIIRSAISNPDCAGGYPLVDHNLTTDNFPAGSAAPNSNGMPRPAPAEYTGARGSRGHDTNTPAAKVNPHPQPF